jgi:chemotaxis protein MotB
MAVRRKKAGGGGAHGAAWVISFADLMSLLMAFFVMLLSFSVQDQDRLNMAAGSVQDAFGIRPNSSLLGIIERDGNPVRDFPLNMSADPTVESTEFATDDVDENARQGPEANTFDIQRSDVEIPQQFALAATTLRQAWQDLPDITFIAENLFIEPTEEGLDIQIIDQDGKPMFPEGSKYPFEATRQAIAVMAPILNRLPNPIRITGHTAAGARYDNPRYGAWELSTDRANVTRGILQEFGLASDRIHSVVGRGENDPLFPNDPYLASNQRISILIMYEQPAVPAALAP